MTAEPRLVRGTVPVWTTVDPYDEASLVTRIEHFMTRLVRGSHEDTCGSMAVEHLATGGKRLRARLAARAAVSLGVAPEVTIPWAAACELLHNASLIHDDLQDGDDMRRGATALWARHGQAQAINAGDLLLMMPTLALTHLQAEPGVRWLLAECVARNAAETARGQSDEIALRRNQDTRRDAYLRAATGKTAGLFGMPVEGAALLAGLPVSEALRLAKPFRQLGLLYQVQDDVVDLFGDKGRGHRGADIAEGKVSALVVAHLEQHPDDAAWLHAILSRGRHETTLDDIAAVTKRFEEGGALDAVLRLIQELVAEVRGGLPDQPMLRAVCDGLLERILRPLDSLQREIW